MPTTSNRAAADTADHAMAGTRIHARAVARPPGTIRAVTATATPTLDPYRLPRAAIPTRYDVELVPDLEAGTFDGRVDIRADVQEPTADLVLNAVDLDILACRVDGADAAWRLEPATERLVVTPNAPLEPGPVTLTIEFAGVLNDKLRGFYRSTYSAPAPMATGRSSGSSPRPRCRPPTAAGRSRAGTSRT